MKSVTMITLWKMHSGLDAYLTTICEPSPVSTVAINARNTLRRSDIDALEGTARRSLWQPVTKFRTNTSNVREDSYTLCLLFSPCLQLTQALAHHDCQQNKCGRAYLWFVNNQATQTAWNLARFVSSNTLLDGIQDLSREWQVIGAKHSEMGREFTSPYTQHSDDVEEYGVSLHAWSFTSIRPQAKFDLLWSNLLRFRIQRLWGRKLYIYPFVRDPLIDIFQFTHKILTLNQTQGPNGPLPTFPIVPLSQ